MSEFMLAALMDMGFSKEEAERALEATRYQGLEAAKKWLLENSDANILNTSSSEVQNENNSLSEDVSYSEDSTVLDRSSVTFSEDSSAFGECKCSETECSDCGKTFGSQVELEIHGITSHYTHPVHPIIQNLYKHFK